MIFYFKGNFMERIKSNKIIKGGNVTNGYVYFENGKIKCVTDKELPFNKEYDYSGYYVSAGFIDIHTHGALGVDFMEGNEEDVVKGANYHTVNGCTSILPTLSSETFTAQYNGVKEIKKASNNKNLLGNILGVHLEGPYFSTSSKGAQNADFITPPIKENYTKMVNDFNGFIKKWTYAPEVDNGGEFCKFLIKNKIVASAGHTDATWNDMERAFNDGLRNVTHLYSCTSTIKREGGFRILGVTENAYYHDDMYVEMISDGKHVPPELMRLIFKLKDNDKIILISDSQPMAGTDDKTGKVHGVDFIVEDGVIKLKDKTAFLGSIAVGNRLVKEVYGAGIPLPKAVKAITENPANSLGIKNKGFLKENCDADFTVFDEDINVKSVFVNGKQVV